MSRLLVLPPKLNSVTLKESSHITIKNAPKFGNIFNVFVPSLWLVEFVQIGKRILIVGPAFIQQKFSTRLRNLRS